MLSLDTETDVFTELTEGLGYEEECDFGDHSKKIVSGVRIHDSGPGQWYIFLTCTYCLSESLNLACDLTKRLLVETFYNMPYGVKCDKCPGAFSPKDGKLKVVKK